MKSSGYHIHFGPGRVGIAAYSPLWMKPQPPNYKPWPRMGQWSAA